MYPTSRAGHAHLSRATFIRIKPSAPRPSPIMSGGESADQMIAYADLWGMVCFCGPSPFSALVHSVWSQIHTRLAQLPKANRTLFRRQRKHRLMQYKNIVPENTLSCLGPPYERVPFGVSPMHVFIASEQFGTDGLHHVKAHMERMRDRQGDDLTGTMRRKSRDWSAALRMLTRTIALWGDTDKATIVVYCDFLLQVLRGDRGFVTEMTKIDFFSWFRKIFDDNYKDIEISTKVLECAEKMFSIPELCERPEAWRVLKEIGERRHYLKSDHKAWSLFEDIMVHVANAFGHGNYQRQRPRYVPPVANVSASVAQEEKAMEEPRPTSTAQTHEHNPHSSPPRQPVPAESQLVPHELVAASTTPTGTDPVDVSDEVARSDSPDVAVATRVGMCVMHGELVMHGQLCGCLLQLSQHSLMTHIQMRSCQLNPRHPLV